MPFVRLYGSPQDFISFINELSQEFQILLEKEEDNHLLYPIAPIMYSMVYI